MTFQAVPYTSAEALSIGIALVTHRRSCVNTFDDATATLLGLDDDMRSALHRSSAAALGLAGLCSALLDLACEATGESPEELLRALALAAARRG